MLSQKQLSLIRPFFNRHQSSLLHLKASSISSYASNSSIKECNSLGKLEKQLFYPWGQRRIFHNVKLKQKQIKAINDVKTIIIEEEKFPVNEFSEEVILRHLHSSELGAKDAYQRLKKIHSMLHPQVGKESFLKYLEKTNYQNLQTQLKTDVIYTLGKSSKNSFPIIILQVPKIKTTMTAEQNFALFYLMISLVLHYRMRPHWQEKYLFLIDLGGISLSEIPYTHMYKFMEWIGVLFGGLCEKILVYNSQKIGMMWHVLKRLLPDNTMNKILFVDRNNLKEVHKIISPDQLEVKYGGNVKDIKQHWPPKPISMPQNRNNLSNSISQSLSYSEQQQQENTTEYFSFKSISMFQSVKINNTSLKISKKKIISLKKQDDEYQIEKQEVFDKWNSLCGAKSAENCHYCKFF